MSSALVATGVQFPDSSIQTTAVLNPAFKNRIINGAMMIDQRNAGASSSIASTVYGYYSLDRYRINNQTDGVFTLQQSSIAPAGFKNSLALTVTTADTSIGAGQFVLLNQSIEGYNVSDLGFGAAGASTVTISFWVRSSVTGTYGGSLANGSANRTYPFSYTVNSANTWEQKTVTIAGDTTGTYTTDNTAGLILYLTMACGSTYTGTPNTWAGATYLGVSGQANIMNTVGNTFYITGVQLEKGSTATSFDYRPYGTELALCQRYCLVDSSQGYNYTAFGTGMVFSTTGISITRQFPVPMRAAPASATISSVSGFIADCGGVAIQTTNITLSQSSAMLAKLSGTVASGLTAGQGCTLVNDSSGITRTIAYNSEL